MTHYKGAYSLNMGDAQVAQAGSAKLVVGKSMDQIKVPSDQRHSIPDRSLFTPLRTDMPRTVVITTFYVKVIIANKIDFTP